MSSNSYAPKVPMTDDEIKRWKPVCADFVSFRAGVRAAERAYNVGDLVRQANHYMDEWSNVCNENQRLLNRIASLEAERDQLRAERDAAFAMSRCECNSDEACANLAKLHAEVERLRKPLTDDPLQVAAALRRLVVSHAHEFGDTFYFGHVASALELCPVCHGVAYDDDLKECGACNGSGKRAIEAAKEAK